MPWSGACACGCACGWSWSCRGRAERLQTKQWIAETTYQPEGQPHTYRLVARRKRIEHRKGQVHLFDDYEYAWVVTNLPESFSTEDVVDHTYQRCDQENVIEQMGSGLAAWRMPVAEFDGNSAWLEIARLAWNIGKWLAQLVLPNEVARWEWKRFRLHFVLVPAQLMGARASDVGAPHGRALDHRPARTRLRRLVTSVSCCRRTTRRRESVRRTAVFARREISH